MKKRTDELTLRRWADVYERVRSVERAWRTIEDLPLMMYQWAHEGDQILSVIRLSRTMRGALPCIRFFTAKKYAEFEYYERTAKPFDRLDAHFDGLGLDWVESWNVPKAQQDVMKAIGWTPEHPGEWPLLRRFREPYLPIPVDGGDIAVLTEELGNLVMMMRSYAKVGPKSSPDDGTTIFRRYDPAIKLWLNMQLDEETADESFWLPDVTYTFGKAFDELARQPRTNATLMVDWMYMGEVARNDPDQPPFRVRHFLAVDAAAERCVGGCLLYPTNHLLDAVIGLCDVMKKMGLPARVKVRDALLERALEQLTTALSIKLVRQKTLPAFDRVVKDMFETVER